jgi:hypothetical protein
LAGLLLNHFPRPSPCLPRIASIGGDQPSARDGYGTWNTARLTHARRYQSVDHADRAWIALFAPNLSYFGHGNRVLGDYWYIHILNIRDLYYLCNVFQSHLTNEKNIYFVISCSIA